jgi:hypothetical protein
MLDAVIAVAEKFEMASYSGKATAPRLTLGGYMPF